MKIKILSIVLVVAVVISVTVTVFAGSRKFDDVSDDAWYAEAVHWAADNGVTNGTSDTLFSPDEACTRAQVVTFLNRYYQVFGNNNSAPVATAADAPMPEQPTEPVEPTAPTEPVEPTAPTEPTEPTAPTEPTESTEPISSGLVEEIEPIGEVDDNTFVVSNYSTEADDLRLYFTFLRPSSTENTICLKCPNIGAKFQPGDVVDFRCNLINSRFYYVLFNDQQKQELYSFVNSRHRILKCNSGNLYFEGHLETFSIQSVNLIGDGINPAYLKVSLVHRPGFTLDTDSNTYTMFNAMDEADDRASFSIDRYTNDLIRIKAPNIGSLFNPDDTVKIECDLLNSECIQSCSSTELNEILAVLNQENQIFEVEENSLIVPGHISFMSKQVNLKGDNTNRAYLKISLLNRLTDTAIDPSIVVDENNEFYFGTDKFLYPDPSKVLDIRSISSHQIQVASLHTSSDSAEEQYIGEKFNTGDIVKVCSDISNSIVRENNEIIEDQQVLDMLSSYLNDAYVVSRNSYANQIILNGVHIDGTKILYLKGEENHPGYVKFKRLANDETTFIQSNLSNALFSNKNFSIHTLDDNTIVVQCNGIGNKFNAGDKVELTFKPESSVIVHSSETSIDTETLKHMLNRKAKYTVIESTEDYIVLTGVGISFPKITVYLRGDNSDDCLVGAFLVVDK